MNSIIGIVFHIIHGSFVDGPGVRTTVLPALVSIRGHN